MKRYWFFICITTLLFAATGCEKEEYGRDAVYGKILFDPAEPYVGDTVKMTVEVVDAGHRIFHADYSWKCSSVFSDEVRVTAPDGAKTITAPPTYTYVFQTSGTFNVSMNARFKFSMITKDGTLFGSASTKLSKITVKNKSSN